MAYDRESYRKLDLILAEKENRTRSILHCDEWIYRIRQWVMTVAAGACGFILTKPPAAWLICCLFGLVLIGFLWHELFYHVASARTARELRRIDQILMTGGVGDEADKYHPLILNREEDKVIGPCKRLHAMHERLIWATYLALLLLAVVAAGISSTFLTPAPATAPESFLNVSWRKGPDGRVSFEWTGSWQNKSREAR